MITGSHNPKDDNGFKLLAAGKPFYNEQIQNLYEVILTSSWPNLPDQFSEDPTTTTVNITDKYLDRILHNLTLNPKLKVAWDPANGAAGYIMELLTRKLSNKNWLINSRIDGNFPAHHPDPTILTNLTQLINLVQQENCDIGIAFDGDADRLGVVSSSGRIISGEQILCFLAKDVLVQNPGATIIMDIKTSLAIFNQIESYGGNPLLWKTGHSYIKDKIQETKALLAGETSGHLFFSDKYYGYDDGIYAAIRLLDLLSRTRKSLDEMVEELPKIPEPIEIKIPTKDTIKFAIIEQIKQKLMAKNIIFNEIDGIRINLDIGWWLLRASNTEAKIIVRYQPNSTELTQKFVSQSNEITESSQEQIVIQEIKHMLATIGLKPSVIKEEELEEPNVNWSERLSGGEKQKIRIIQAILSQPTLLIMDEATSALDPVSKQAVYTLIKEHLQRDYIVIYTDHGEDKGFADCSLRIIGQNLVESYELSDSIPL
ncbi:Phosphomannomutase [Pseudolycoriella hygida]|uniref:Phosphomannomutase n=1 Tax=Pseudolycoriella hygida TaxID=35572 RepID=A0A9Q0S661_9DIPT|nr:Phosphomannomutase [Pseudolycoriella hygida]